MPSSPDPGKEGGANAVDQSAIVEAEDFFGVEGAIYSNVPLSEGGSDIGDNRCAVSGE